MTKACLQEDQTALYIFTQSCHTGGWTVAGCVCPCLALQGGPQLRLTGAAAAGVGGGEAVPEEAPGRRQAAGHDSAGAHVRHPGSPPPPPFFAAFAFAHLEAVGSTTGAAVLSQQKRRRSRRREEEKETKQRKPSRKRLGPSTSPGIGSKCASGGGGLQGPAAPLLSQKQAADRA